MKEEPCWRGDTKRSDLHC